MPDELIIDSTSDTLPDNWEVVDVRSIGRIETGSTPSKQNASFYGNNFPFYKPSDLEAGYNVRKAKDNLSESGIKQARFLPENSILVTCIGATIGKAGIIRRSGASNQQINAIILSQKVLPSFVYYQVIGPAFQKELKDNASATTLPILNKSKFERLPFVLPPIETQQRIVSQIEELFSELDKSIEDLKTAEQQLKVYRQSVLKYGTSGLFTSKNNKPFYTISIGANETKCEIKGWQTAKLIDIAILESGHTPRKTKKEYWENGDVLWISLQDIREADGTVIQDTKYKTNKLGIANSSARLLPKGTVVFSRDISVGFVTIMGKEMSTTQHFANWICSENINNIFLMYCFMASRESLIHRGQGTTVKTIYMPELKQMQIQLPLLVQIGDLNLIHM